jgi:putative NADPH-quinone reductase
MKFDPVSDRRNFTTVKNPDYFKQQIEEMHATEVGGFAPDVEAELRKMEACDLMIWQFPLWWFGLPGILKGWADRVFAMGRTYGGERFYENGVFKGKRALLSLTTGGPEAVYQKGRLERGHPRHSAPDSARDICASPAGTCCAPNIVVKFPGPESTDQPRNRGCYVGNQTHSRSDRTLRGQPSPWDTRQTPRRYRRGYSSGFAAIREYSRAPPHFLLFVSFVCFVVKNPPFQVSSSRLRIPMAAFAPLRAHSWLKIRIRACPCDPSSTLDAPASPVSSSPRYRDRLRVS